MSTDVDTDVDVDVDTDTDVVVDTDVESVIRAFDSCDAKELLRLLCKLKEEGPDEPEAGICEYVGHPLELLVTQLAQHWPEFSGNVLYPVPDPRSEGRDPRLRPAMARARYVYGSAEGMWNREDPYGAARWRLVDWLIQQLEKNL